MLKPLKTKIVPDIEYASDSPLKECEYCHKLYASHRMINCIIIVGSPGHESLQPFQCEQEEHWSCCIEHWNIVAKACIDEHMTELLKNMHKGVLNHG